MSAICSITRSIRSRIAVLAVAGIAALGVTSGVAQADSTLFTTGNGDYGYLQISTNCDYFGHEAAVSLAFQTPFSETNGLWVQTVLYYKDSNNPSWSVLAGPSSPQYAKTSQGAINTIVSLAAPGFYGTPGRYYDVGVYYRVARPGAGYWTQWKWMQNTNEFSTNLTYDRSFTPAARCGL